MTDSRQRRFDDLYPRFRKGPWFRRGLPLILLAFGCAPATAGLNDPTAAPSPFASEHPPTLRFPLSGADGVFLAARFAATEGDLDYAADQFLRALDAQPDGQELTQPAFLACLMTDRPETGQLARELTGNPAAQLYLIDKDALAGKWDSAEARVRQLPSDGPTAVLLPLINAWLQAGAGHADAALATLRPLETDAERLHSLYELHAAMIADLANRPGDAGRLYRAALSEPAAMNLRVAQIVASWEERTGKHEEAARVLNALTAVDGELAIAIPALVADIVTRPIGKPTDGIAEGYLALAGSLRQQDATDFAMVLLRLALDLRPDLTPARLLMAEIKDGGKHPAAALQILAPVAANDPLIGIVRLRRAALTDRAGDTDQAIAMLRQIAHDYPDRPDAEAMMGDVLREKNRFPEAVDAYDRAIAKIPNLSRTDWPLLYARGIALERAHQWQRAQADFEQALKLSPDQPYVLNYLGYSWTERGENLAEAEQMIERAVKQRPNDGAIIDSLGWVQLRQGDTKGAVDDLEHAVELQPEDPTINAHLGDAYWAAGRKLEARYQWQRALTMNPEPEDVAKIETKLHDKTAAPDAPGAIERSVE